MKLVFLAAIIALCEGRIAVADDILARYQWDGTPGATSGALLTEGKDQYLRITNTNSTGLRVQLLKIQNPAISSQLYVLFGEVRYQEVQGDGFLEMWNVFLSLIFDKVVQIDRRPTIDFEAKTSITQKIRCRLVLEFFRAFLRV